MPAEEEEGRSGGRWTGEPLPRKIDKMRSFFLN
jgi:hypothetical protein